LVEAGLSEVDSIIRVECEVFRHSQTFEERSRACVNLVGRVNLIEVARVFPRGVLVAVIDLDFKVRGVLN
jgi:hypothetical protein